MLLVVDIGNSSLTFGVFENDKILKKFYLPSSDIKNSEYLQSYLIKNLIDYKIDNCIIGSVSDENLYIFKPVCDKVLKLDSKIADYKSFNDLIIDTENPQKVGIDRLANVYALKDKYDKPVIVIDIGTAVTFDIMLPKNIFLGGIIFPGINTQLKALNLYTSKLPEIELKESFNVIGKSTEKAILSGVIRGIACEIDGLIEQCEKELGQKAVIIACGGQSELISKYMNKKFDEINTDLTLCGLSKIFNLKNKISC